MGSRFGLEYTEYFLKQWQELDEASKRLIQDKLSLIVLNPFRFRKHKAYEGVFKVKLSIGNRYSRLMYAVHMPEPNVITVLGIFPRGLDYKDFERMFGYLRS